MLVVGAPPIHVPIPKDLDAKGRMARKLRKKQGREICAKRKTIVEPVFGQTKEARGLRRFLLRGLTKVNGEWMLWGMTHNLGTYQRCCPLEVPALSTFLQLTAFCFSWATS